MATCPGIDDDGLRQCDDQDGLPQQALRHVWVTPLGGMLLVCGLVMVVLPGPSLPLLFGGLVLLSREYEWARRLLAVAKRRMPFTPRRATKALSSDGLTPRQAT